MNELRNDCCYLSSRAIGNKEWSVKPLKEPVPGKLVPVGFKLYAVRAVPPQPESEICKMMRRSIEKLLISTTIFSELARTESGTRVAES